MNSLTERLYGVQRFWRSERLRDEETDARPDGIAV
jgi:hypothetical protein